MTSIVHDGGAVGLAEQILVILDRGAFTATYKYAVLLALLDVCLENTARSGAPPTVVTTRQLAEKVVEVYWRQVESYAGTGSVLTQMGGRRGQRATILAEVKSFRDFAQAELGTTSLHKARTSAPEVFHRHLREVEWTLIRYPLPLLQTIGRESVPFLYRLGWEHPAKRGDVRRYQLGASSDFDNRILLLDLVGEHLIQLNGLLRFVIQKHWVQGVSQLNRLEEDPLEGFLFGMDRTSLERVRDPLLELQGGKCFYCERSIMGTAHVDHFVPWSRYASNALDNLVAAHEKCNLSKSDHLAATAHVEHWATRTARHNHTLEEIATEQRWERAAERTLSVARSIYLRLPSETPLWVQGPHFEPLNGGELARALGTTT